MDRVLSLERIAEMTGYSRKTLLNWSHAQRNGRRTGHPPFPFRKRTGKLVALEVEVGAWIREDMVLQPGAGPLRHLG